MELPPLLASVKNGDVRGVEAALAALEAVAKDPTLVVDIDRTGNNALHLAAIYADPEIVELLLRDGRIDINAVNNKHETALLIAAEFFSCRIRKDMVYIAQLLLNAKDIDPTIADYAGKNALHAAILYPRRDTQSYTVAIESDISMLDMLLKDGRIDPTTRSRFAGEPIHEAVGAGNLAAVDRLLKDPRVDPTSMHHVARGMAPRSPRSPLEIAYTFAHKPIALRLLEETRVMETITPEIRDWLGLTSANIEKMIAEKAWARRRHATTAFAKYWESRAAEGGKRTRRNKRRVGRRVNAIGGRRTRLNKRCVGR